MNADTAKEVVSFGMNSSALNADYAVENFYEAMRFAASPEVGFDPSRVCPFSWFETWMIKVAPFDKRMPGGLRVKEKP